MRTNLHQNVVTKILKSLETKRLIKAIRSVKNSTKKVYMLYHLQPSIDVTGGPWFSDNEFDNEFIQGLSMAIYRYIYSKTFSEHSNIPYSHKYKDHPSTKQIHHFVQDSQVSKIELSIDDIQSILDSLVYDGKIESIQHDSILLYRAIKQQQSSLSMPCISCPLFDQCNDFGSITPLKCEYFSRWLRFD